MLPNTRIFTGYFAKAQDYTNKGMALVSIALKDPWFLPKDLTLYSLKELAPTPEILALKDDPKTYEERYRREVLGGIFLSTCIKCRLGKIQEESGCKDLILLCWEKGDKFCHRHIAAKWLTEQGILVKEYNNESE